MKWKDLIRGSQPLLISIAHFRATFSRHRRTIQTEMLTSLQVLLIQNQQASPESILDQLHQAGFIADCTCVETEAEYLAHFHSNFDLILIDDTSPHFDPPQAIHCLQQRNLKIPIIVITNHRSQESTILKQGVVDYVLNGQIVRLRETIRQIFQSRQSQYENQPSQGALPKQADAHLQESEEKFKAIFDNSLDLIMIIDGQNGQILKVNQAVRTILKYTKEMLVGRHFSILFPSAENAEDKTTEIFLSHQSALAPQAFLRVDGTLCWMDFTVTMIPWGAERAILATFRDVTARKQAEEALARERALLARRVVERTAELSAVNAQLARAARLKDEFLANMSHELRTPLNAILGMAEILQGKIYGTLNQDQKNAVGHIEESGRHLLALINDVLDISKFEAGKLKLDIRPVSVIDVCEGSLRFVKQMAQKKNIDLPFTFENKNEILMADGRRLKQILVNLLTNAVKFTPEGGQVGLDIICDHIQGTLNFIVWDTGIGISEDNIKHLFKPFVQLDSSLSRHFEGAGLGLSLAYRLTEMHGGSITVKSKPEQGSQFTVSLPWHPEDQNSQVLKQEQVTPYPSEQEIV
ncbi:MAG: ATP-binding protein, partial [Reinekea sp.]|nr:ATP-binding protein [Reinekea sp.]